MKSLKDAPAHTSKIGGNPAIYKERPIENQSKIVKRRSGTGRGPGGRGLGEGGPSKIFLYQIDLSTIPIRLREVLGGSGLLQMFFCKSWGDVPTLKGISFHKRIFLSL